MTDDGDSDPYTSWQLYKGDATSSSYSALDQINRENVAHLEVAWEYNSGDQDDIDFLFAASQVNPVMIDHVLYITTPALKVDALNAVTGERIWRFDPFEDRQASGVNRGVVYWEQEEDKRIFFTAGPTLYALNAETGKPVETFGRDGEVDLREGLGRDPALQSVSYTSPGIIHGDKLIMGSTVGEGVGSAPGHIRAYNTRTGEIEWTFHTIPQPGEYGHDTWGESAWLLAGGTNNWGGISLDREREIVFVPTVSPAPDFYTPGTRGPGRHLFGNSILALDANTGELIWYYQVVPHDLWDYDLPAPANLVTVERDGEQIDAVAQVTKQGFVFVLDRETGEPLFSVEDRPVPGSPVSNEEPWPTQRFPTLPEPFVRQEIDEDHLTNISEEANVYAREQFRELRYEGLFTPVGTRTTLYYPGSRGGANWGGASYDPVNGMLYVNANEIGSLFSLREVKEPASGPGSIAARGESLYLANCASCHGQIGGREPGQFPSLVNISDFYTTEELVQVMAHGRGIMPALPHLNDEEMKSISEYLHAVDSEGELNLESLDGEEMVTTGYAVDTAYQLFLDQNGYPATKPPWGSLNAIDLNTGELVWKVPLGEYEELSEQGVPVTGTQNLGGSIVTAGGLVFIAAAEDEIFRAFDKSTGEILWEHKLPAGGHASPSTYMIDGIQYLVIAATGGSRVGTRKGDSYVAFTLPSELR